MVSIVAYLFIVNSVLSAVPRTPINLPTLAEGETRVSSVSISYGGKMRPTQALEFDEAAKRVESRVHWEGNGAQRRLVYTRTEISNNGSEFKHVFNFQPGKAFRMKDYENTITAPDGEVVQREYYSFASKTKKYPDMMLHPFTIDLALRTFDLKPGSKRAFDLWLSPTTIFHMETVVIGIEDVVVMGGKKTRCYKIEMAPNFAEIYGNFVNGIIRPLVPKFTFWIRCDEPRIVVRYVGPLGQINPVGGPVETQELISYTASQTE